MKTMLFAAVAACALWAAAPEFAELGVKIEKGMFSAYLTAF